jgi:hypothetical protein
VERWNGGTVERWNGGTVERWNVRIATSRVRPASMREPGAHRGLRIEMRELSTASPVLHRSTTVGWFRRRNRSRNCAGVFWYRPCGHCCRGGAEAVPPFHRSTVPPFHRSTVPPFHRQVSPPSSTVPPFMSPTAPRADNVRATRGHSRPCHSRSRNRCPAPTSPECASSIGRSVTGSRCSSRSSRCQRRSIT